MFYQLQTNLKISHAFSAAQYCLATTPRSPYFGAANVFECRGHQTRSVFFGVTTLDSVCDYGPPGLATSQILSLSAGLRRLCGAIIALTETLLRLH